MALGENKTYTIPIGPVHVGLKEPITAWLQVDGERIVDVRIRPGAIHRGIEYMARERNPIQVIYLAERICGICSFAHIISFVRAVEDAAGIPVPPRAKYIRTIYCWSLSVFIHTYCGQALRAIRSVMTRPSTLGCSLGKRSWMY